MSLKVDPKFKILSPCVTCRHKGFGQPNCAAFPDGIPIKILKGENDHRESFPGDQGIQWAPIPVSDRNRSRVAFVDNRRGLVKLEPVGLVWLDDLGVIGFTPLPGKEDYADFWNQQLAHAYGGQMGPNPSGHDFFDYWSQAGNGITMQPGPIITFSDADEMEAYLKTL